MAFDFMNQSPSFSLANFEGPLELLCCLLEKKEVDILEIAIKELTTQLIDHPLEMNQNADTLALLSSLLLLKSQKMLPKEIVEGEEGPDNSRLEMLQALLEYCRFKEAAKSLGVREETQKAHFPRQATLPKEALSSGLDTVALDDLTTLLGEVMQRARHSPIGVINPEIWEVAPKIEWLRTLLLSRTQLSFEEVFHEEKCRDELIVTFIALLELMKVGEIKLKMKNTQVIIQGNL